MIIMKTLSAAFGAALNKRKVYLCILCLIIVTLWNTHSVTAAPAKLDSLDSTFPLDFQPPVFEITSSASANNGGKTTVDSYGNPIETLQPINTPDGRKVVSAQGLQFEIPNYASGITELNKPAGALLPPFVGEFNNDFLSATSAKYRGQSNDNKPGIRIINKDTAKVDGEGLEHVNTFVTNDDYVSGQLQDIRRYKRQLQFTTLHTYNNNTNNNNSNAQIKHEIFSTQTPNTYTNQINVANTTTDLNHTRLDGKLTTNNNNTLSSSLANSLNVSNNLNSLNLNSRTNISPLSPSSSSRQYNNSFQSPSSKTKLSPHYNNPLSNGNFNYPNVPTDASIIERIVSKYEHPLPTLDPIVVALPDTSSESFSTNPQPHSSDDTTTSVDVESVPLVEVKSQLATTHSALASLSKGLPDYILELNDPDIAGPVDYVPSHDKQGLNVIAWDLLPPQEAENNAVKSISHNKVSITTGHNLFAQASQESSHATQRPQLGLATSNPNYTQYRGGVSYSSTTTTPKAETTSRRTTTTARTTTTPRTTTTTRRTTTTPRTTTPRTTTTKTTTPQPDSTEFFKLAAGDSYTLPPWLLDIDDPDLDVAVAFEVPEDLNQYNHTVDRDLLPPLEPYTDLNNIHLTSPQNHKEATTTTTARTTTSTTTATPTRRPPNLTTIKPHWVRAKPTSPKPTIATFNHQFTSLSPFSSSTNFAQRTTSTTTTTTTTVKPKTSTNFYNRQLSSTTSQTDKINSSGEDDKKNSRNPFLSNFDDGKYKPQLTTRRTTTSTTTTTTPAPEIVEKNPFEATIPPWLKDFDYPNVGPGVPFIYDPNEDENPVDENILPPSNIEDTNAKTNPSPDSPFLNSQTPQGFTNKFTSSALPSILSSSSFSSIPSIVTNPLPSIQTKQADSALTLPPNVFVPAKPTAEQSITNAVKSDDFTKHTSSTTFNKNFAAPFDPATSSSSSAKKEPLSADRESFPPFNNIIIGSSTIPSKTTFIKSEDGKVITNNVFLNSGIGSSTSARPIGSRQPGNGHEQNTLTTPSSFGSGLTTTYSATGFVTTSASSSSTVGSSSFTADGTRYTGRFGGPPGVLSPQGTGFTASSSAVTKSYSKPIGFGVTAAPVRANNNNDRFSGSFGGPPGILKPYDNVKNR